ncbi:MAG: alpha/beta fold hydrolase [Pseudomonadota bacterium]
MADTHHLGRIIVCLHGIWMKPGIFWYMQQNLNFAGYPTRLFGYSSVQQHLSVNADSLQQFLKSLPVKKIDFIAHSLGGLLLLNYFAKYNDERLGRSVLLGSPLAGSAVARCCHDIKLFRPFLGKSQHELQYGISHWAAPDKVIMIAGTKNIGLGNVFGSALAKPNDGTVAVIETKHPKLHAHYQIPETHTSMMYSKQTLKIIKSFFSDT